MSVNGRFMSTDCLPVTGKDGKTVWIFKLEDLREVVDPEVYEVIEKLVSVELEDCESVKEELTHYENSDNHYVEVLREVRDILDQLAKDMHKKTKVQISGIIREIRTKVNNEL